MAPTRNFVLHINEPRGARSYRLRPGATLIGTSASADIFLHDASVSSTHARIDLSDDEIILTDLDSRNGTYVSKKEGSEKAPAPDAEDSLRLLPTVPLKLGVGDRIQVGLTALRLDEDTGPVGRRVAPAPDVTALPPVRPAWYAGVIPPGLSSRSLQLLGFLPEIYRSGVAPGAVAQQAAVDPAAGEFLDRFLALFESVLLPIEWVVDNFDLYLDPRTTPDEFLPWLEEWFGFEFAATLAPERRRKLLRHAHRLFQLKGTRTALIEAIELAIGCTAEVEDLTTSGAHFIVTVRCREETPLDRALLEQLIVTFKPIHTTYQLVIAAPAQAASQ